MCSNKTSGKPTKTRAPRFQDQWVSKTIEKTKQQQNYQDFRTNGRDPEPLVLKSWFSFRVVFYRWFSIPIDPDILVFLCCLVFSMVFATHWSWNLLVCLFGILDAFSFPSGLHTWIPLVFIGFTNMFCFHSAPQAASHISFQPFALSASRGSTYERDRASVVRFRDRVVHALRNPRGIEQMRWGEPAFAKHIRDFRLFPFQDERTVAHARE